ncbi:MAG: protein kinase [Acidobacteria bacterium]|nr:protein kinase [Acidobacteriota bacterium]
MKPEIHIFDRFRFDANELRLSENSQPVALQPKAAEMLAVFLLNHGATLSRDELMKEVWKETFVDESNIRFIIHILRKTLGKTAAGRDFIETVPKRGYRFAAAVSTVEGADSLGRYRLIEKIGAGGMGEVYLARDPQLDRPAAIKLLLPEVAGDEERILRFRLEAKAVSALNHPNIVTIYEIGEADGRLFIAYEFVEGAMLREKIRRRQLTVEESLAVAEQAAAALGAAHRAGIVHRDVKPENIMVRDDGYVKILDFGLAKRVTVAAATPDDETLEWVRTKQGMIIGSVQYMSPEQSRGLETDARTDVWSLGVVLYEMLTGENPFDGPTVSDSIAAILHFDPRSIDGRLRDFPAGLRATIEKALRIEPADRYATIDEFAADLRRVRRLLAPDVLTQRLRAAADEEKTVAIEARLTDEKPPRDAETPLPTDAPPPPARRFRKRWLLVPLAGLLAGLAGLAAAYYLYLAPRLFPPSGTFRQIRVTRLTNDGQSSRAAISDDARRFAFVRRAGEMQTLVLSETGDPSREIGIKKSSKEILQPVFRGDSLYYVLRDRDSGTLYRYDFRRQYEEQLLTGVDSRISFAPDGRRFAFVRQNRRDGGSSVFVAPADLRGSDAALTEAVKSSNTLLTEFHDVVWQNDGQNFTVLGENRLPRTYETKPSGVRCGLNGALRAEWARDSLFLSLVGFDGFGSDHICLQTAAGDVRGLRSNVYSFSSFDLDPAGRKIVVSTLPGFQELRVYDPKTGRDQTIVDEKAGLDRGTEIVPTADGKFLFASRQDEGREEIYSETEFHFPPVEIRSVNADGTNPTLLTGAERQVDLFADHAGKFVFFHPWSSSDKISLKRIEAPGAPMIELTDDFGDGRLSADDRWFVFTRKKAGPEDKDLYKMPFAGGDAVRLAENVRDFQIAPDGRSVFYKQGGAAGGRLMKTSLANGATLKLADGVDFFNGLSDREGYVSFTVAPDGGFVVYGHDEAGGARFFKVPADGGAAVPLGVKFAPETRFDRIAISPDGKLLGYLSADREKKTSRLAFVALDDRAAASVPPEREIDGFFFAFAPDNRSVVYSTDNGFAALPLAPNAAPRTLLETGCRPGRFDWLRDGRLYYLCAARREDVFLIEDVE